MSINFVGDVCLTDAFFDVGCGIGRSLKKGRNPFANFKRSPQDLYVANLECVLANQTIQSNIFAKQFILEPEFAIPHLDVFDLYSLANNHVLEHGEPAYLEMCQVLNANQRAIVGSHESPTQTVSHQGKTIGFAAWSLRNDEFSDAPTAYVFRPCEADINLMVDALDECEFKIALVHWGEEFIQYPNSEQRDYAKGIIDAGFNLIIGHHSHTLQGYEEYNGARIYYSLGNFLFNIAYLKTQYSAIVKLDLSKNQPVYTHDYIKLDQFGFPNIINGDAIPTEYTFEYLNQNNSTNKESYLSAA